MGNTVIEWGEVTRDKVRECSHTILCCWNGWEEIAGQDSQVAQSTDAYFDTMYAQLDTVLMGLLDEVTGPFLSACKALMEAEHYDHFAARMSDSEMEAIEAIKAAIAHATEPGKATP